MTDVDRIAREKDVETLRQMALLLVKENERLVAKISEMKRELAGTKGKAAAQLRLEIAALEKDLAKRSGQLLQHLSEKRPKDDGNKPDDKPPQTGHGPREQPKLLVEDVVHDLDEADKTCPACGGGLEEWPGQFEESEEVDVVERRFVLRRHKRKKYRCRCGGCVETAPMPKRLLGGGRYSAGFAIVVAIGKYLDHLPLERGAAAFGTGASFLRRGTVARRSTWRVPAPVGVASMTEPPLDVLLRDLVKGPPNGVDDGGDGPRGLGAEGLLDLAPAVLDRG